MFAKCFICTTFYGAVTTENLHCVICIMSSNSWQNHIFTAYLWIQQCNVYKNAIWYSYMHTNPCPELVGTGQNRDCTIGLVLMFVFKPNKLQVKKQKTLRNRTLTPSENKAAGSVREIRTPESLVKAHHIVSVLR